MKLKNTLVLLILAGGLFAFIKLYEGKQLSTREAQERAGRITSFDRDKVDTIYIKNSESKIELRKDPQGVWRLEQPVKDRADSLAVNQLFTAAEALHYDGVVGDEAKGADKEQLKEFGLINSETRVKFVGKEKPVELAFGKDAAIEGKVYVKLESSNRAYVIGKDLRDQVSKKPDDFRDRRLTELLVGQVDKVTLKTPAGEILLEKKDLHWSLTKPLKARGNDARIGDLIAQTASAHVEGFVADGGNASSAGLQEPSATISLYAEGAAAPVVVQLGAHPKDDPNKIYAKVSTRESVVLLSKSLESLLKSKPDDLRDRGLVRVEPDIVDRINIQGEGKEKIVMARSGESWVRKTSSQDAPVNVAAVRRVLEELKSLAVLDFVSDVATDLPKYGLDHPAVQLTLSSFASENTAETKAGEKPIVSISFGSAVKGAVYAKVEDEPFIVSVPQSYVDLLMTDPLQWQPLEIFTEKADDITSFDLMRVNAPLFSLQRNKDKTWGLAKGDGTVNQVNVQSLVNTLATLRAVRWVGPAEPDYGLDQPTITCTFRVEGKAPGKLTLGKTNTDEQTFATVEGREGVFCVSRPDLDAFKLPLLEHPATPQPSLGVTQPVAPAPAPSAPVAPAPAPALPAASEKPSPAPTDSTSSAPPPPASPSPAVPVPAPAANPASPANPAPPSQ